MRLFLVTVLIMMFVLVFVSSCLFDEVFEAEASADNQWNGTWVSELYTLTFLQNGSDFSGGYEPYDITLADPGILEGMFSEDGRILSGTWTETGTVTFSLSDDGMFYNGTGVVRLEGEIWDGDTSSINGTRVESSYDPENVWNGTWMSAKTSKP